jgi:hypothetical protein
MINILNKRSSVQGNTPTTSDLQLGEIGINTYDGKIFIKKDAGTAEIVEVGRRLEWELKSANYVAGKDDKLMVDTSSASVTITLPSTVNIGDEIILVDYEGTWSTNNVVLDGNGKNIMGSANDLLCDVDNAKITLIYTNTTDGWRVFIASSNEQNDDTYDWSIKTANYTAEVDDKIMADTSSSAFTITLPASPTYGFEIVIVDYAATWSSNNLTVNGNSENINGSSSNVVYDLDGSQVRLVYTNSSVGWESYVDSEIIDGGLF